MSLIIKEIDLPKENETLYILLRKDRIVCHKWEDIDEEYGTLIGKEDIEVVQIERPHGRLGDLDKLFEEVGKIRPRNQEHYKAIGEFMNLITNIPTILKTED